MDFPKPKLVDVPGGTFLMGDINSPSYTPNIQTVRDFKMGAYCVKFEEYDAFCEATGRDKPNDNNWGRGKQPVINVNWYDACAYCNWLTEQEGVEPYYIFSKDSDGNIIVTKGEEKSGQYRLPSAAEWEYAARQCGQNYKYGDGTNVADSRRINFADTSEGGINRGRPVPCEELAANSLGLHSLSGNLWEMTNDEYTE